MKKLSVVVLVALLVSTVAYGYQTGHWEDNSNLPETWTSGSLGIGTDEPEQALHVKFKYAKLLLESTYGAGSKWFMYARPQDQSLRIRDIIARSCRLIIDKNGNVGIGTTSPGEKLEVNGNLKISGNSRKIIADGTGPFTVEGNPSGYNFGASLKLDQASHAYIYGGNGGGSIHHVILAHTGSQEWGNVGIGTTTPSKKLDVNGEVRIESKLEVNDDINVKAGPDDNDADIILTDASGDFGWIAQDQLSGAMWIEHAEGQRLKLSGQYGAEGVVVVEGVLGVGTDEPQSELAVNGTITAREVIVTTDGWPDFVFSDNHKLMLLNKLEQHIKVNKSLPGIPTEKEVLEGGVNLGDMQAKLLEKVEELTLYTIAQDKRLTQLEKENEELKKQISSLRNR